MQPEARFKQRVDKAFDRLFLNQGGWRTAIEKGRGQKSGLPDRLYCAPPHHVWVESKIDSPKLDPLQDKVCRTLSLAGMNVATATFYPHSDTIAWAAYNHQGELHPGFTFTPIGHIKELNFWSLLLTCKLHSHLAAL